MKKAEFIKKFSKIEDTFEDEFRAEFNSPQLIWEALKKQLTLTDVSQQRELLMATLTSRVLTIQSEPDGVVRETMINNLLVDINCG